MKIERIQHNIIQLAFQQEKTDKDYGTCTRGSVLIDCDNYSIAIESDCGNYSYSWTSTPNSESFVALLCRLEREYFLDKISDRTYFDFEKSKNHTIKNIREDFECLDEKECKRIISDILYKIETFGCEDEIEFYNICDRALGEHSDPYLICIEKDYPAGAKKIAQIFKAYIQPYLRKHCLN